MSNKSIGSGYFSEVSVVELGTQLRKGSTTSRAITEAALEAIGRLNPTLNAFVHVAAESAIEYAGRADQEFAAGMDRGPLHGIPVAVKDNVDTIDMPTTYGTRFFANHQPERDAKCVENLRRAGAVLVGKTLTSELAMGPTGEFSLQGAALNPYDQGHVSGGSSAGSACAVGSGMVPLAVGTDTGGSIRIPGAFCGVVGFKPSYGKVPLTGVFPVSRTLDHVGPIANSCTDAALLLAALADETVPTARSIPVPIRAAWLNTVELLPINESVQHTVKTFAYSQFSSGITDISLPPGLLAQAKRDVQTIFMVEAFAVHAERILVHEGLFSPPVVQRLKTGGSIRGWEYIRALEGRQALKEEVDSLLRRYDLILLPTTAVPAPELASTRIEIGAQSYTAVEACNALTGVWNLIGYPTLTVPAGTVSGLPVGLQIVCRPGSDYQLLQLAEPSSRFNM